MSKERASAWWSPFGRRARARARAEKHLDFADMGTVLGLEATLQTTPPRSMAAPDAVDATDTVRHTTAERLNARLNGRSVR